MKISDVIKIIKSSFKFNESPVTPLPPPLVYSGALLRTGVSVRKIAARIISRQSEAGAPVGALTDGSDNISEKMEVIRIEEIMNALLTEAVIEVVIPPGVSVTAVGGNAGGPIVVQGTTVTLGIGKGIIR